MRTTRQRLDDSYSLITDQSDWDLLSHMFGPVKFGRRCVFYCLGGTPTHADAGSLDKWPISGRVEIPITELLDISDDVIAPWRLESDGFIDVNGRLGKVFGRSVLLIEFKGAVPSVFIRSANMDLIKTSIRTYSNLILQASFLETKK